MQKTTKDLLLRLKALHPGVHGISYDFDTDWKSGHIVEKWYLHIPNKYITFESEKDLQNEIKRLINSTERDLGFMYPHTTNKLNL